ncbi:MAG: hypothetical protein ACLTKI_05400 [Lachnospiraceae bacterium]
MLQLLETGKALYVLAAICAVGMFSKLMTRGLYKRLIKETNNMVMTKNKNLKLLKQKVESTYRVNSGIGNMTAYLERQMYDFRFMGVTLSGWANLSSQMTLLCLLAGGSGAFLAYWYRLDTYYIVLYGSMGILTGLLTMVIDNGVNLNEKRQQLLVVLQDYMENSLFFRPGKGRMDVVDNEEEEKHQENSRIQTREKARESVRPERSGEHTVLAAKRAARSARREAAKETPAAAEAPAQSGGKRDVDYLKHSLEQIAASRERTSDNENWVQEMSPNELQLIGEILRQYLA